MSLLISFFLLFSIKNVSALQSDITSSTLLFVLSMNLNQQINKHTDRHSRIYVFRHTRQMTFSLSRLIVCGCQLVSFRFILFYFYFYVLVTFLFPRSLCSVVFCVHRFFSSSSCSYTLCLSSLFFSASASQSLSISKARTS